MRVMASLVFLVAIAFASLAGAQDYPSRPVRIIVPFPAGGASDIVGRVFAEALSELWKEQVIVENRVGAGGSIGTEAAYRSKPDGYTLLLGTTSQTVNQALIPQLPFTYTKDFPTIAIVSSAPMMNSSRDRVRLSAKVSASSPPTETRTASCSCAPRRARTLAAICTGTVSNAAGTAPATARSSRRTGLLSMAPPFPRSRKSRSEHGMD